VGLLNWFLDRPKGRRGRRSKLLRRQIGRSNSISFIVGNKPIFKYDWYVMGVFCGGFKLGGVLVISDIPVAHARDTV